MTSVSSGLHESLLASLDARTLELLERRRSAKGVPRRGWLVRRMLLAADVLGLTGAFVVVELVFLQQAGGDRVAAGGELLLFVLSLPVWVVTAKLYGLYDRDEERADHSTADDVHGVLHLVTVGTWLLFAGAYLTGLASPQFPKLLTFWALAIVLVGSTRAAARAYCRRQVAYLQNTIVVGSGEVGQMVARKVLKHREYGLNLVGFVDADERETPPDLAHLRLLGEAADLPQLVQLLDVERVVVAFPAESHSELLDLVRELSSFDLQVDIVPRFFEVLSPSVDVHTVEGLPLIGLRPPRLSSSSALLKRTLDLVGATVGLVLLAPLLALVALAIKLDSSGPVLFRQTRMGARNRTFEILKLRTMVADADARKLDVAHLNKHLAPGGDPRMFKIDEDPRVTRVGRLLRRFSLDELPQLWNVLRGEMSLVGPRPLILDEHQHVTEWGIRRIDLRPGITGLWQVLGRDDIAFDEMVRLDYLYVTSWSVGGDIRLLLRTVPIVWFRRG